MCIICFFYCVASAETLLVPVANLFNPGGTPFDFMTPAGWGTLEKYLVGIEQFQGQRYPFLVAVTATKKVQADGTVHFLLNPLWVGQVAPNFTANNSAGIPAAP